MIGTIFTAGLHGIEGYPVQVEADMCGGLPSFDMVGFLGSEVREARERVRSALRNSGIELPPVRLTVNLSPANQRKAGNGFDLPIAAAILSAAGILTPEQTEGYFFAGELGLDGSVKPIHGAISITAEAIRRKQKGCILPKENAKEGASLRKIPVYGVTDLRQVIDFLKNPRRMTPEPVPEEAEAEKAEEIDFSDVIGQRLAVRAAEIAAAGMHNLLLSGPPGTGKSMLAHRITTILPELTLEEQIELTKIYSVRGMAQEGLIRRRPFRSPHHTISVYAMAGGGANPRPGEISLAHCGVLFLDELPEFRREALEVMRQPMEDGEICLSRTHGVYRFPARFMLVAARNPCRCGYYPDRSRCRCSEKDVMRYQARVSKPLLDRIDLSVEMPALSYADMEQRRSGETSAQIRERVLSAVERQKWRMRKEGGKMRFNSGLSGKELERFAWPDPAGAQLLRSLYGTRPEGLRSHHKLLRVARTIADLKEKETVGEEEISEAWFLHNTQGGAEGRQLR